MDEPAETSEHPLPSVLSILDAGTLQALCHPTRVEMLEALREPASAAALGRRLGQPRQRVNYHLKTLEGAGLVRRVGARRQGNFTETLYRAAARSFLVSPRVTWSGGRRLEALRTQHSLETLVALGERLQQDAAALLDRAAYDGEEIPSAAVSSQVAFATEGERAAFLREYLKTIKQLLERHGAREGEPYRVVLAVHPREEGSMQ